MKRITGVNFKEYVKTHNDRKPKTTSGVTIMLYGETLGRELSKAQSNIIGNGTVLENLVSASIRNAGFEFYEIGTLSDYNKEVDMFDTCRINDDTFDISDRIYLIDKRVFKDIKHNGKGIQPDLLALIVKDGKVDFNVIELKAGDNFDTKKSSAEKVHLTVFVDQLNAIKGIEPVYKITPFFSNVSKDKLSKYGFKNVFSEDELLTRDELSELFGIDFNDLIDPYEEFRDINIRAFLNNLCEDPYIREILLNNSNMKKDIERLNSLEKSF